MSETFVKIDGINIDINNVDNNKIDIDNDIKPHKNKPITKIEVSPNEKYLVTYSQDDHSIVGWNIEDIDEGRLNFDHTVKINPKFKSIDRICVSDDKKLAFIYNDLNGLEIIDMNNDNQVIELNLDNSDFEDFRVSYRYFTFNLKGEFILYNKINSDITAYKKHKIIWIYSTQTKNNKWMCKRIYEIPKDFELIGISKNDKLYLFSNNSIYEWNILNEENIRMFKNEENEWKVDGISSNENFTCLRIKDKIIIYSVEIGISIASLDINNDIQIHNFMNQINLCPLLLLSLFDYIPSCKIWNSITEHCWKECLDRLTKNFQLPKEYQNKILPIPLNNIKAASKYIFGILDGYVWKIKLDEKISKINFLFENSELNNKSDEIIESNKKTNKETLNVHFLNSYKDMIHTLFQKGISYINSVISKKELIQDLVTWNIKTSDGKTIKLQVFKRIEVDSKWDLICTRIDKFNIQNSIGFYFNIGFYEIKLFNDDDIGLLTNMGLLIYRFNKSENSISLIYFYYIDLGLYTSLIPKFSLAKLHYYKKVFSKLPLPSPNYVSFKLNDEWTLYMKENMKDKENLLKYGIELLTFAIKEHKLELINYIYEKCIIYYKEDLVNNRIFLSIITSTMAVLNEYYPEYILKYSLETNMIIDSSFYNIEHQKSDYSFKKHMNNDLNNPWNIVPTYNKVFDDGTIDTHPFIIQSPDKNTNMFEDYRTSLFAMYLFLTGDSRALSNWSYIDNPSLVILIFLFSLLIVVYLMNLFIGLLNNAIEKDNNRVSYLIQKAEILAEIELFYLLPHQRRWNTWFPEVIYYYANADKTRKKIKEMIDKNEWYTNDFPELKQELLNKLNIQQKSNS
ncbi:hypothetical protein RhiirB3_486795 [Rhizophagus irregularis]|nr:hypothetical protein RhiirB3_486795 [Rhizophagus irregularis]